jgi:vacuolar protein sorting-associated protein 54
VTYHAARLTQSAKLVEEEIWTQVDVAPDAQHSIDLLIVSAVSDPPECRIPPLPSTTTNGDKHSNSGGALAKFLSVEDKTFFVVRATTESMTLLSQYLGIVINLELVVTDVMARIIEFLKVSALLSFVDSAEGNSLSTPERVKWFWGLERCDLPVSKISQRNI